MITPQQLHAIMPALSQVKAETYLPYLNVALAEGDITTPLRKAAFLAQLSHESGELKYFEEIASGKAYEGRKDLGNVVAGDGVRFKGRGPIQLTGRANYRSCGKALGIDLENSPEKASELDVAFRTAVWYWTSRKLNVLADQGTAKFDSISYKVNGGWNGKDERRKYYQRALSVLEVG